MPCPWVSGHALLKSSACWAHGCVVTCWLTGPAEQLGEWGVGRGSAGTARSTGAAGRDLRGDGLGDGFAASGTPAAAPRPAPSPVTVAAAAGAWAATTRARPSAVTAIRLMRAASVDRQMPSNLPNAHRLRRVALPRGHHDPDDIVFLLPMSAGFLLPRPSDRP